MEQQDKVRDEKLEARAIFYLSFIFIFLFGLLQFNIYHYFDFGDFDLAIYNQVIWNTLHGNFFYSSIRGGVYFKDHIPLILLLFTPIYALFQSPLTLLFLQSIFLGLAAWPLFLIAKDAISDSRVRLTIILLYLIYPALGWVNLFEFHPDTFSVFFLLFTFYFLIKENFRLFVLFMILSLMCKEDVSLTVLMLGIYAAFVRKSKRWILTPLFCGILWFVLSIFVVIPYFNKGSYIYTVFYSHLGKNFPEIAKTMILHPIAIAKLILAKPKLDYLLQLFLPVSFLPFYSPLVLLATIPAFLRNLLAEHVSTASIYTQYSVTVIPFIFISSIYAFKKILFFKKTDKYLPAIIGFLLIVGIISGIKYGPQFNLVKMIYSYKGDYLDNTRKSFVSSIPKDAAVISTFAFLPRLSSREKLYTFHYVYFGREKVETSRFVLPGDTEYALIDFNDHLTFYGFYSLSGGENMRKFLKEGNWGVVKIIDSIVLLKRNFKSDYKLFDFENNPKIENKISIAAFNKVGFLGYDTKKEYIDNKPVLRLSFYWKCLEKMANDFSMEIAISDKKGRVIANKNQPIAYNIFPTYDWQKGEMLKGNYWFYLPLNNHLSDYHIRIILFDKLGIEKTAISFNL